MASTQATRTIFINTLVDWCRTYGYDGVNIDWEYPGDNNRTEDRENLTALIREMRQAFTAAQSQLGKYLEISIDVHSSLYYATWVDFATIKNYVDWGFGISTPLKMSTAVPARIIGETQRGVLRVGNHADLILIDDAVQLSATYIGGRQVYATREAPRQ